MSESTVIPIVNLDELDLLDDKHIHAFCSLCYPPGQIKPMTVATAICGRRALIQAGVGKTETPPDACPDCRRLYTDWWTARPYPCCKEKS